MSARRHRELPKRPEQHKEMYQIMFVYSPPQYVPRRRLGGRDKSDATYSNHPCLRYGTLSASRGAGFNIQNLFRIKIRIDFVREVFLGGCARNGWEEVEFCMQSSSTFRNDKSGRRSRPSQLWTLVLKRWGAWIDGAEPIAGAQLMCHALDDVGECDSRAFCELRWTQRSPSVRSSWIDIVIHCEQFGANSEAGDGRGG